MDFRWAAGAAAVDRVAHKLAVLQAVCDKALLTRAGSQGWVGGASAAKEVFAMLSPVCVYDAWRGELPAEVARAGAGLAHHLLLSWKIRQSSWPLAHRLLDPDSPATWAASILAVATTLSPSVRLVMSAPGPDGDGPVAFDLAVDGPASNATAAAPAAATAAAGGEGTPAAALEAAGVEPGATDAAEHGLRRLHGCLMSGSMDDYFKDVQTVSKAVRTASALVPLPRPVPAAPAAAAQEPPVYVIVTARDSEEQATVAVLQQAGVRLRNDVIESPVGSRGVVVRKGVLSVADKHGSYRKAKLLLSMQNGQGHMQTTQLTCELFAALSAQRAHVHGVLMPGIAAGHPDLGMGDVFITSKAFFPFVGGKIRNDDKVSFDLSAGQVAADAGLLARAASDAARALNAAEGWAAADALNLRREQVPWDSSAPVDDNKLRDLVLRLAAELCMDRIREAARPGSSTSPWLYTVLDTAGSHTAGQLRARPFRRLDEPPVLDVIVSACCLSRATASVRVFEMLQQMSAHDSPSGKLLKEVTDYGEAIVTPDGVSGLPGYSHVPTQAGWQQFSNFSTGNSPWPFVLSGERYTWRRHYPRVHAEFENQYACVDAVRSDDVVVAGVAGAAAGAAGGAVILPRPETVVGKIFQQTMQPARTCKAADMESAALLHMASIFHVPALVCKAISDRADRFKDDGYHTAGKSVSALVALRIVEHHLLAADAGDDE